MIINDKRALAYTQKVGTITPIDGADNIELIHVNAWTLIAKKGEFQPGDMCVFFEIDSHLPEEARYEFLRAKHFNVKTYKLGKFGVVSQGLAMPMSEFPEVPADVAPLTDLTELLKVTYSVAEDNSRKAEDPAIVNFKKYKAAHPKFYSNPMVKRLMRFKWFRALQLRVHGGKMSPKYRYPSQYVSKTDEERIQNCPQLLEIKKPFVVTEKIDGSSLTVLVEQKPFGRFKTYVCSRNICYGDGSKGDNFYVEAAKKYDIVKRLKTYVKCNKKVKWACIQGEVYGEGIQSNPLKIQGRKLAVFNFIESEMGRLGSLHGRDTITYLLNDDEGTAEPLEWVPIVHEEYVLPDTVEEMIEAATGPSSVNPNVLREGWVVRSQDGQISFKAVSTKYLLKKKE